MLSITPNEAAFPSIGRADSDAVWASLPTRSFDARRLAKNRIVTASRSNPSFVAFDMLRTALLHTLRQNKWSSVAITSPTLGCGKTVLSLNLAFSFAAQKECRTALVDLDLRRPRLAELLGMTAAPSMEGFLRGNLRFDEVLFRHGDNIAIAANNRPVHFAAELLQSTTAAKVLKQMRQALAPDVTIFDLPPLLANDDVLSFLPNVDCVVLVVAAEKTTVRETDYCERLLAERTNVAGVVLNKCRYTPGRYDY